MQSPEWGVNQIFSFMAGDDGCLSNRLDMMIIAAVALSLPPRYSGFLLQSISLFPCLQPKSVHIPCGPPLLTREKATAAYSLKIGENFLESQAERTNCTELHYELNSKKARILTKGEEFSSVRGEKLL